MKPKPPTNNIHRSNLDNSAFREWGLVDAKNKLNELVNLAISNGPQLIQRRNDRVIVLSLADYEALKGKKTSFKKQLMLGESFDGLDLERVQDQS